MPITFHTADIKFTLGQKRALQQFILLKINELSKYKALHLSFIFCSDEYLLNINRQFLNHDYYTDIITFPLTNTPELLEAEIYISVDRVRENSSQFAVRSSRLKNASHEESFRQEILRVIFHGILHLLGHKDKTPAQKAAMRKAEDQWLKEFSVYSL